MWAQLRFSGAKRSLTPKFVFQEHNFNYFILLERHAPHIAPKKNTGLVHTHSRMQKGRTASPPSSLILPGN